MRWLKSLVTLLGVLIVGGLLLLGYGFYKKTQNPDWRLSHLFLGAPAETPAPAVHSIKAPSVTQIPAQSFGEISLGLPAGCLVTDVNPDGPRAYLTIGPPGRCHRVVVVDSQSGRILGSYKISP
jgi:hypothetical protein